MIAAEPLRSTRIGDRGRSRSPPAGIGSPEGRARGAARDRPDAAHVSHAAGGARSRSLIAIDFTAVTLALYVALVSKQMYRGAPVFWGFLWRNETDVLPFIVLIVGLVFAKNGLYRSRESRPGGAAIIASLAFSTLIVALFALVTGREFNSYATFFVTFLLAVVFVTLLRASYDSVTLGLMRSLGMRRRTLLAGRAEALGELYCGARAPARRPRARDPRHRLGRPAASSGTSSSSARSPTCPHSCASCARTTSCSPGPSFPTRRCSSSPTPVAARARGCASCRRPPSCCCSARASCRARSCRCSSCARPC